MVNALLLFSPISLSHTICRESLPLPNLTAQARHLTLLPYLVPLVFVASPAYLNPNSSSPLPKKPLHATTLYDPTSRARLLLPGWDVEIAARTLAQPDAQASSPTAALLAIWAETALEHPLLFASQLGDTDAQLPALPIGRLPPPETLHVPGPADCTMFEGPVVAVHHAPTASPDKSPPSAPCESSIDISSLPPSTVHDTNTGPLQQSHPPQGGQLTAGQVPTSEAVAQTEAVEAAREGTACQKEVLERASSKCRLPFGDLTNRGESHALSMQNVHPYHAKGFACQLPACESEREMVIVIQT